MFARKMGQWALLTGLALLLVACVRSDVNRFNSLPTQTEGKTFIIVPLETQNGSAEFDQYARNVAAQLERLGFVPAQELEKADYAVLFNYGIAGSQTVTGAVPLWGQTGGGTSYQSGTVSAFGSGGSAFGSYSGTTYTAPTYGLIGMMPYSQVEHSRFLILKIIDLKQSIPSHLVASYEGQVSSSGRSSTFAQVADCMFDALFKNFRASGSERVTLSRDSCGK